MHKICFVLQFSAMEFIQIGLVLSENFVDKHVQTTSLPMHIITAFSMHTYIACYDYSTWLDLAFAYI